jgi:ABC-type transport system substrate-binding protein
MNQSMKTTGGVPNENIRRDGACGGRGHRARCRCRRSPNPKRGGILKFAVSAEPPNYDCHANSSFAFIHPVRPHYSTLLKFDAPNYPKIKGDLAASWDVSKDGLTYTFKLRDNVKLLRLHG